MRAGPKAIIGLGLPAALRLHNQPTGGGVRFAFTFNGVAFTFDGQPFTYGAA